MKRGGSSGKPRVRVQDTLRSLKGRNRASAIEIPDSPPITIPSSPENVEEDDEFEEVAIPIAGPSTVPGTPGTPMTPYSMSTPNVNGTSVAVSDDEHGYMDEEEEEEEEQVIRLEIGGETPEEKAKRLALAMRKKPLTSKDRAIRLEIHKMHVICLLASAQVRNRWACSVLLQARLLSLLPHPLQAAFVIPPKRFPDKAQRSRLFLDALQSLVTWWSQAFFDISDPRLGLQTRTWDSVQDVIDKLPRLSKAEILGSAFERSKTTPTKGKGKGKSKGDQDPLMAELSADFDGERLRSVNSMAKKALLQEGSRDISAQLFVALARACNLGARLVVSVQAVPWRAEKVVAKKTKKGAGSGGRSLASKQGNGPEESDDEDMEEVPIPGVNTGSGSDNKGQERAKDPADLYRLRKVKPPPQTIGGKPKRKKKEDLTRYPPVFWAEIYSRSDQRWIPVDPLNGIIRKKSVYEPHNDSGPVRMSYVVAFEEDGYARDVTLRYAKNFAAKTCKFRAPGPRPGESDWWGEVTGFLQRPTRLNRDEIEDAELEMSQMSEGMPMHMNGFKDHPLYVLERHLKRDEVLHPKRECGRFKGELVFKRSSVLQCKTAENWMRSGRQIKRGQEPLKWVKQRAVTLEKRRAQELAVQEGQEPIQQGLYSHNQTELYIPPPIQDGIIPQNAFGNIDLYVPSMLPAGAVHLPYKGIAKVAKQLKVSYAEAVTSFEFKKQRALPVITGIVVAADKEDMVLDAYWKSAAAAEEREKARREDRALKRWAKLINGLRVRRRLQAEYGTGEELEEARHNPMANVPEAQGGPSAPRTAASIIANATMQNSAAWMSRVLSRDSSRTPEPLVEVKDEAVQDPPPVAVPAVTEPEDTEDRIVPGLAPAAEPSAPTPAVDRPRRSTMIRIRIPNGTGSAPSAETPVRAPRTRATSAKATPTRATPARAAAASASGSARGKGKGKVATRKRKADANDNEDESEAELSEDEEETLPSRRGRAKVAAAAPVSLSTRSLRSRGRKTEEQLQEEEEKRARIHAALASDQDDEE